MESTYSEVIPVYDENEQQNGINFEEAIPIGSDFEADVLLIQIGQLEVEKQRIDDLFQQETDHIKGWRDEEITKLDKKRSWLSHNLEVFLVQTEKDVLGQPMTASSLGVQEEVRRHACLCLGRNNNFG